MSLPSSKFISLAGAFVAALLIAGVLSFISKGQDVRALIQSWKGLNADHFGLYNSLVNLRSQSELNYDEVSALLYEQLKHETTFLGYIADQYPEIYSRYSTRIAQDSKVFEYGVERFKSHLAVLRNSTRFIVQQSGVILVNSSLSELSKREIELSLIKFALKPNDIHKERAILGLDTLSAAYLGDTQDVQNMRHHLAYVTSANEQLDENLAQIAFIVSDSALHRVEAELEGALAVYARIVYSLIAALVALVLALLIRMLVLSQRTERAVEELSELNAELDKKIQAATSTLREKVEQLNIEKVRAEDATRAKSEFLANMSHEIRTPLNGISGMAQILQKTNLDKDQQAHISTILTSTGSLSQVINDILDFSKIEAGKVEIEHVDFNLLELVESVVDQVTLLANKSENQLVIHYSSLLPECINSDPSRIRQIMLNLLSNANKFTHNGSIEVRAELLEHGAEQYFKATVKDSGIGISDDKLAHIFDAFSQEDSSTTRRFGGTGLGLSICKRLSQLMGGDIAVSSVQGEGSSFSFYLPLKLVESADKSSRSGPLRHIKPLIFDNNDIRRRAMQNHLESWHLPCVVFDDISDFIFALQQLDSDKNIYFDATCLIVNMDEYQRTMSDALSSLKMDLPKLYLTPLYSEDFGEFDRSIFCGEVRSPIKPSEFLDALADAHSQTLGVQPADIESKSFDFSGRRILLVDDNEINRTVAELMLESVGVEIVMAEDGRQAVDKLADQSFDLVFMDCQMPVMDGYEASQAIRQFKNPSKRDVPIVAMTANAMKGDKEACLAAGMDDYISKPVEAQLLYELMGKWLGHTHSEGMAARD